jgi:hypothetical protein
VRLASVPWKAAVRAQEGIEVTDSRIPNGTAVKWTSQANAGRKTKKGVVLAFVPAWEDPIKVLGRELAPNERMREQWATQSVRYIVAVPRGGKSKLVDLYLPRASVVERGARPEKSRMPPDALSGSESTQRLF